MAQHRIDPDEPESVVLTTRLTPPVRRRVLELAEAAGKKPGTYVRELINDAIGLAEHGPPEALITDN